MKDVISIIVPVYNVEEFIDECIKSLISQTYENIEIILVNDGSTDKSGYICREYESKDNRIKVINQKNGGVSSARNIGLMQATGKYITFVDSDDYVKADYIEVLYSYIKKDTDIVCCNVPGKQKDYCLNKKHEQAEIFSLSGYTWGKLIRKECIKDVFSNEVCYAEDYIFYIKLLKNINKMQVIAYEGYYYRVRPGSLSVKDKKEGHTIKEFDNKYTFISYSSNLDEAVKEYDKKTRQVVHSHCCYVYSLLLLLMYRISLKDKKRKSIIQKWFRKYMGDFFRITLLKEKNVIRFFFGAIICIFPNTGGRIGDKLLS